MAPANTSGSGLDSNSVTGQGGISHQYSTRNTLGGNYAYSYFSYPGYNLGVPAASFDSQTASLQYIHQFTRKLSLNASAGPEWTSINVPGSSLSLSLYANAVLAYSGEFSRASLAFVRSTNSGYASSEGRSPTPFRSRSRAPSSASGTAAFNLGLHSQFKPGGVSF